MLATKAGQTFVVQCKHWQSYLVKPDKVREVIGSQAIERAQGASLVTLRGFTPAARQLAQEQGVELVEERQLLEWINELRFTAAWSEISSALDPDQKRCPRCESALVRRTAMKGTHRGSTFWGCSTYPHCKFILPS
jgi:restriction system protein